MRLDDADAQQTPRSSPNQILALLIITPYIGVNVRDHFVKRVGIALLALAIAVLGTAAFRASVPAVAFFARSALGVGYVELGLLTTCLFVSRALAAFGVGYVYRPRLAALAPIAFALNSITTLLYLVLKHPYAYMALRAIQGALNGIAWPLVQLLYGYNLPRSVRGRGFAVYFLLGQLGVFLGNYLYALLASFTKAIVTSSALFALTAAMCAVFVRAAEKPPKYEGAKQANASVGDKTPKLPTSAFLPLFAQLTVVRLATSIPNTDIVYVYAHEVLGLPRTTVATIIGSSVFIGALASYFIGWIADKVSDTASLALATALGILGSLSIVIASYTTFVIAIAALYCCGMSFATLSRRIATTYAANRALTLACVNAAGNTGMALGSITLGATLELLPKTKVVVPIVSVALVPALAYYLLPLSLAMGLLGGCLGKRFQSCKRARASNTA